MKPTTDSLSPAPLDIDSSKEPLPTSGLSGLRGRAGLALMTVLAGCRAEDLVNYGSLSDGSGGGQPCLTLPFEAGQDWQLTRGYGRPEECIPEEETTTHCDWGSVYYDDYYALDFARTGTDELEPCQNTYGQNVYPVGDGVVSNISYDSSDSVNKPYGYYYGNSVRLNHGDGYESQYSHLSEVRVSEGDFVTVNDVLGEVGATGNVVSYSSCSDDEKRGSHLHLTLYKDDEGIMPEPLSGATSMIVDCFYDREGNVTGSPECEAASHTEDSCDGSGENNNNDSDDHEENDDDSDGVKITFADISPHSGSEEETAFVWVAIVDSPYDKPDANLWIYNPDDRYSYEFEMETESEESPWVFTYRKTLNDNLDYTYWVLASGENRDGEHTNDSSNEEEIDVDRRSYDEPENVDLSWQTRGEAGETEFEWTSRWDSADEPDVDLKIVSAADNKIYTFDMDISEHGGLWEAEYEKTLRDAAIYTFWMEADNGESTNTTEVKSIEVTD